MKTQLLFVVTLFICTNILAQNIIKLNNTTGNLKNDFNNILLNSDGDFFIGYSIKTDNKKVFCSGNYFVDDSFSGITLGEVIENSTPYKKSNGETDNENIRRNTKYVLKIIMNRNHDEIISDSKTAIIFYYKNNAKKLNDYSSISIVNFAFSVNLSGRNLYWLGNQQYDNSLSFLFNQFDETENNDTQSSLLTAISIHRKSHEVTTFLIDIVENNSDNELREDAIFWLGTQDNIEALETLKRIIYSDESHDLREKAIMGLSQLTIHEGFEELINIAKKNSEHFLREKAILCIGEVAFKNAEKELKNIVENDPEIEIKKHALYALAERETDMIPYFIKLAKTHSSISIKKHVIYLLADSQDERAIDALIELATN